MSKRYIRPSKVVSRQGNVWVTSYLLYIGSRPHVVVGLHRTKAYFVRTWNIEITRYPKTD
jgi:hypothetical protein